MFKAGAGGEEGGAIPTKGGTARKAVRAEGAQTRSQNGACRGSLLKEDGEVYEKDGGGSAKGGRPNGGATGPFSWRIAWTMDELADVFSEGTSYEWRGMDGTEEARDVRRRAWLLQAYRPQ